VIYFLIYLVNGKSPQDVAWCVNYLFDDCSVADKLAVYLNRVKVFSLYQSMMNWEQGRSYLVQQLEATVVDSLKIDYSGVTYRQYIYETTNIQRTVDLLAQVLNISPTMFPLDGIVKIIIGLNDTTQGIHVYFQKVNHSIRQTYWFDIDSFKMCTRVKIYSSIPPSLEEIQTWLREHISNDKVYERVLVLIDTLKSNMYIWTSYGQSQDIRSIHFITRNKGTTDGTDGTDSGNVVKLKDIETDLIQLTYWLTHAPLEIHKLDAVFANDYFAKSYVTSFAIGLNAKSNRVYIKVSYNNALNGCIEC